MFAIDKAAVLFPNRDFFVVCQNNIVFGDGHNCGPMHKIRAMHPQKYVAFELFFNFRDGKQWAVRASRGDNVQKMLLCLLRGPAAQLLAEPSLRRVHRARPRRDLLCRLCFQPALRSGPSLREGAAFPRGIARPLAARGSGPRRALTSGGWRNAEPASGSGDAPEFPNEQRRGVTKARESRLHSGAMPLPRSHACLALSVTPDPVRFAPEA